jgi:hypothetical protein
MEAATSAPAVGYTVEQVRAQQNDRIFRRAVQNLHVQIIEVTGERARTGDEACEALEKLPTKDVDRAQSAPQKALMRIFVPAKVLTSILTTRSMAASAPCELARATCMAVLAARLPIPGEHARRILAASLWYLYPGCPQVPLLVATSRYLKLGSTGT